MSPFCGLFSLAIKQYHKSTYFSLFLYIFYAVFIFNNHLGSDFVLRLADVFFMCLRNRPLGVADVYCNLYSFYNSMKINKETIETSLGFLGGNYLGILVIMCKEILTQYVEIVYHIQNIKKFAVEKHISLYGEQIFMMFKIF